MAKFCSKECEMVGAICDFCKYYGINNGKNRVSIKHMCNLHLKYPTPGDGCNDFICWKIKEKKND